jgi:AraC-like DNA-binding protein
MPIRSPTIPARYVTLIIGYAESLGLDRRRILAAAELRQTRLDQPDAALTLAELDVVLSTIARLTGRRDLGFEVGRRVTFSLHGALGLAIQRCVNLDQALTIHSRCYPLITPSFVANYHRERGQGTVTFCPVVAMRRETMQVIQEMQAVSFHVLATAAVLGGLPPYDIFLPMDPPAHASRYRELAPARVHFGHQPLPEVRIVCDATMLEQPLAFADPRQATRIMGQLERSLPKATGDGSWSDWIRMLLDDAEDCQPTLSQVAEIVGVGHQTLARRLVMEDSSFRLLSKRVRHERACTLLREGDTPIAQISYRLGYTSVANFSTAFRRVAGVSPRRFRAASP